MKISQCPEKYHLNVPIPKIVYPKLFFRSFNERELMKALTMKKFKSSSKIYLIVSFNKKDIEELQSLIRNNLAIQAQVEILHFKKLFLGRDLSDGFGFFYGLENLRKEEKIQLISRFFRIGKIPNQITFFGEQTF